MTTTKNFSENQVNTNYLNDNEISIFDILDILFKNKKLIILFTLFSIILSGLYAFSIIPTYQAKIYFSQPDNNAILEMNKIISGYTDNKNIMNSRYTDNNNKNDNEYTTDTVYNQFITNFNSKKYRASYFKESNLEKIYCEKSSVECIEKAKLSFDNSLSLIQDKTTKQNIATFNLSVEPVITAKILNNYSAYINSITVNNIAHDIESNKSYAILLLRKKIAANILTYKNKLKDEIVKLNESILLAKKLGYKKIQNIAKNSSILALTSHQEFQINSSIINSQEIPFFLYGTEYLEEKINILLSRKSIKPFAPEIRDIENRISYLEGLKYDKTIFHSVTFEQKAETPKYPIKPKKKLIVIIGALLGMMLSFFYVFIKQAFKTRKALTQNKVKS